MVDMKLVCPDTPATGLDFATTQGRLGRGVSDDILKQAPRRLFITSLLMSGMYLVAWPLGRATWGYVHPGSVVQGEFGWGDWISLASIALSLGVGAWARKAGRDPQLVLDIGLAYQVAIAFGLSLLVHVGSVPHGFQITPIISWTGPIMLMFAAILPNTPGKTLAAGLLSVSMNPLAMLMAKRNGHWDYGSDSMALLMHYPDFLLIPAAIIISRVVTGLGQQLAKARELGSYELGERIGRGAMGEVYRAKHRMFARPAAIKLIRPDAVAPGDTNAAVLAVKRFRREAEAAAQLRSPHTVALYDFGVTADQTLYFVMELLEGMDLQSVVTDHGPLPARRVIYLLRQVCDSLNEAHAMGLVHRDIKPANIHVGHVGLKHDFVKVLDFGLVKSLKSGDALESQATQDGLSPGTPAYMPPEAVRGDPVDGRSDLYALGCVAYYLLTGLMVFEADNGLKMIAHHLQTRPVPPSRRAGVKVPAALEDLIMRCLEKNPEDRPAGADEVGRELREMDLDRWTQAEAIAWWQEHAEPHQIPRAGRLVY